MRLSCPQVSISLAPHRFTPERLSLCFIPRRRELRKNMALWPKTSTGSQL